MSGDLQTIAALALVGLCALYLLCGAWRSARAHLTRAASPASPSGGACGGCQGCDAPAGAPPAIQVERLSAQPRGQAGR